MPPPSSTRAGHLYIHIPFCHHACHYCNFHFSTTFSRYRRQMLDAMRRELAFRRPALTKLKTLFFGGGTPSLLQPRELKALLTAAPGLCRDAEVTLEANPEDITEQNLQAWQALGINRLSIGIQSFHDRDLRIMNRTHTAAEAEQALSLAGKSGIRNLSADLIFALPDMKLSDWQKNASHILDYPITHLSVYALTVEDRTVFGRRTGYRFPDDEETAKQYRWAMDFLKKAGFTHYEISNFSRGGFESRHNTAYWKDRPYMGIGPGAHSYDGTRRRWNLSNNARYIDGVNNETRYYDEEILDEKDHYNEWILCGLRCREGCNLERLNKFPHSIVKHFHDSKSKALESGLLIEEDGAVRLSTHGQLLADYVARQLILAQ